MAPHPRHPREPLLILGASARAAAVSARRAGFAPWTADLFADADLRAMVPNAVRCPFDQYPQAFRHLIDGAPQAPWVYTGGLENHPNLIRELTERRPLWGNGPAALAASRSPFTIERLLREAGLPTAEVWAGDAELPGTCRWLRKPLKGSGGHGIGFATKADRTGHHFYQQFLEGPSYSAVFVRARGEVRLLGATEQLVGPIDWLNAPAFAYAGNIGPVELAPGVREDLVRIGTILGEGCGLLGLFGVDYVLHRGRPHVVEVNPRYTASVEVLERATGVCALGWHRLAFDPTAAAPETLPAGDRWAGKAILYASRRLVAPASLSGLVEATGKAGMKLADVPHAGEVIEAGWPVLTALAEGEYHRRCLRRLRFLTALASSRLAPAT